MKKINDIMRAVFGVIVTLTIATSCSNDFLEVKPRGLLLEEEVLTIKGAEHALIGAYSGLDGQFDDTNNFFAQPTNWLYGSVCGGDAHKGSSPGDQADALSLAKFEALPSSPYLSNRWSWLYEGIRRSNFVLQILNKIDLPDDERQNITAQARFLRAFYAFEARRTWKNVQWIDTTVTYQNNNYNIPNNIDIYPMIEADFKYAFNVLPEVQKAVGMANKWSSAAFLAKVYLFQNKFDEALPILNDIINNGTTPNGTKYALQDQFKKNFELKYENSSESIFAIQASMFDGSGGRHGRNDSRLNFPYGGGLAGCCGFFQPSIDLVNSFRTNSEGLPLLDGSYNTQLNAIKNDLGLESDEPFTPDTGNIDPRLDWTAGRRGIPYLDWGVNPGKAWVRDQKSAGPYLPIKNAYSWEDIEAGGAEVGSLQTATNYDFIKFSHILLWAAECEIEIGSLDKAQKYVNMIRKRAANPSGFVKDKDGNIAANYVVGVYPEGWFANAGKELSRNAVRFEQRLEFAMEGYRFFDLVRWGVAEKVLNDYFKFESDFTDDIRGANFIGGINEYFPIPQIEIDLSEGELIQNNGY